MSAESWPPQLKSVNDTIFFQSRLTVTQRMGRIVLGPDDGWKPR
jgi:hypothetical protein